MKNPKLAYKYTKDILLKEDGPKKNI